MLCIPGVKSGNDILPQFVLQDIELNDPALEAVGWIRGSRNGIKIPKHDKPLKQRKTEEFFIASKEHINRTMPEKL